MNANFIEITTREKVDELFQNSNGDAVMFFKHSTTCPISSGVFQIVSQLGADVYLIVVQRARDVSNYIAEKTGVRHESPQAIIVKNGEPVYHASHYDVELREIENYLK